MVRKAPGSDEFGLPQTVIEAAKKLDIPFRALKTDKWFEITSPEDLKKAEELLGDSA